MHLEHIGEGFVPLEDLADAAREAVDIVCKQVGPMCPDDDAAPDNNFLSFVITNGRTMLGHQGGKNLFCSTHKGMCSEKGLCPHYAPECETEQESGFVSHLIFSSEPLSGENVWRPMEHRGMIDVDWRMQMRRFSA